MAFGILMVCCIILLGYMNYEARTVEVTALSVPGAPSGIVFIADPHVRPENLEHTREVIRVINSLHPSIVLIGGDFSFHNGENLSLQSVWKEIDAPVYAILGNHDYRAGINGGGIDGRLSWLKELFSGQMIMTPDSCTAITRTRNMHRPLPRFWNRTG